MEMTNWQKRICLEITNTIRKKSEEGQLIQPKEISTELIRKGFLNSENHKSQFEVIFRQCIEKNEDLKEISERNGTLYYYSTQSVGETYAKILLKMRENPFSLIAEIVRENSEIYPRPIPLEIFKESPFDLTHEEILAFLNKMAEQEEYQDIAQTTTSVGTIFLYSTRYLEPLYASSLAEWLDVGQANNP